MAEDKNTLVFKMLLEKQPEFRYTFGDPRTTLMRYLMKSYDNVMFYGQNPSKPKRSSMYVHTCTPSAANPASLKRQFKKPDEASLAMLDDAIKNGKAPFVILPILAINTGTCVEANNSRHMVYGLYNRFTHELERIDIKKYHIRGFRIKLIFKSMKNSLTKHIETVDPGCYFVNEHDVTVPFLKKIKCNQGRYAYPFFLMAYLHERLSNPLETSGKIIRRVNKLSVKQVTAIWERYVQFQNSLRVSKNMLCDDEQVKNLESGRCVMKYSKRLTKHLVEAPVKECKSEQVFDILANRCVKKEKLIDINVRMNEVMSMSVAKDAELTSLGNNKTTLPAVMYVLSKHTNALLVNSVNKVTEKTGKGDFACQWRWNEESKSFDFSLPKDFWKNWKECMLASQRFLITLVSLVSKEGGLHANVLIYDKNRNELERFDGLGPNTANVYGMDDFDKTVKELFESKVGEYVPEKFKYFAPIDYCPRKVAVFQSKELDEVGFDDLKGNCAVWRLWYIDTRLANENLPRDKLVKYAMKKLENFGSFARFIKSYQAYIVKQAKL